ncbi:cyclase family protein [Desertibacillus haloalkaliphilus]|uniref:cyclase family protein n=1 Tax=Desertibacillus haloalkaliphilus TaxID=1328930 RepID=UPI001C265092|nr:cyclase family protein [Desertibacillus haloalkaliphilus]MBU8907622.1 cyclase family protein [Desertibacillus haloalkaliphilus]
MNRRNLKMIDLSVPLDPQAKEPMPPQIDYITHEEGAKQAAQLFGLEPEDFPDQKAWANEAITLSTHSGTHVDAPWHYASETNGERSRTIDELPLEWFYGDGVLFDFSNKQQGYEIQVDDFKSQLKEMKYDLKPYDIVLIRTDADKRYYQENYAQSHAGVSADATRWLIDKGIKVMGTDGWGWDIPFYLQANDYKQNPRDGVLWAAHFVGKEQEYCQIEKLANLEKLPVRYGFKVAVFPVSIKHASAGWARPVAILE